jgi:predicted ATPase
MNTPAAFVGRQSELCILRERFAAAQQGDPQVVYLEGEAGGGKSTLLSQFLRSLPAAVVLQAGGDEAETFNRAERVEKILALDADVVVHAGRRSLRPLDQRSSSRAWRWHSR